MIRKTTILAAAFGSFFFSQSQAQTVREATGANAAAIQSAVDAFRADLGGGAVAGANGSFGGIRREINWDGVPDALSAPNNLPANFFNVNSPRGVVFSTSGSGFQVSANASNPTSTPVRFGNLNATYPSIFQTFSPQRLFTALGSNVLDVNFFLPGTAQPAAASGFGAVFTDVDTAGSTKIDYFDFTNNLIFSRSVLATPGSQSLSFLGVSFGALRVGRVRITSGNVAPGADDAPPAADVAVMDDFIYGEPQTAGIVSTVPTLGIPGIVVLAVSLALAALFAMRKILI